MTELTAGNWRHDVSNFRFRMASLLQNYQFAFSALPVVGEMRLHDANLASRRQSAPETTLMARLTDPCLSFGDLPAFAQTASPSIGWRSALE